VTNPAQIQAAAEQVEALDLLINQWRLNALGQGDKTR
jgi:hypothetical protein